MPDSSASDTDSAAGSSMWACRLAQVLFSHALFTISCLRCIAPAPLQGESMPRNCLVLQVLAEGMNAQDNSFA
jgi:hypothetical protein